MSKTLDKHDWKSFLPDVFDWAERVSITFTKDLQKGLHVVAVKSIPKGDKAVTEIPSPSLPKDIKSDLLKACEKSGWQPKLAPLYVTLQDQRFLLVPLSPIQTTAVQISRQFGMDAARGIREYQVSSIVVTEVDGLAFDDILDGLALGFYEPGLFKGGRLDPNRKSPFETLPKDVFIQGWRESAESVNCVRQMMKATAFTRMLQDAPPNWLTPVRFGEIAADISRELGMKCNLLGTPELEDLGCGSFLSVAAGSSLEPRLIAVEIKGKSDERTVAMVGKGLTFDAGGISLKPAQGMGEMKYDMSGGAAVLGAAYFLGNVKPAYNVVCIIGAVENMPGPSATRPSDIVVAMNGKTIDVQNTDAEGRLVLADLLHYTNVTYSPDLMVNIATLTGACVHALGHAGAAIMSNDQTTADFVMRAAREEGEPLWQLPLWPELEKEIKGEWSDVQNIAKPNVQAGSIVGGLFLAEFVGQAKWAHLDIAGTGWSCKATGFPANGGSSFGLRTLVRLCFQD